MTVFPCCRHAKILMSLLCIMCTQVVAGETSIEGQLEPASTLTLVIAGLFPGLEGNYTCVGESAAGTSSASVLVELNCACVCMCCVRITAKLSYCTIVYVCVPSKCIMHEDTKNSPLHHNNNFFTVYSIHFNLLWWCVCFQCSLLNTIHHIHTNRHMYVHKPTHTWERGRIGGLRGEVLT